MRFGFVATPPRTIRELARALGTKTKHLHRDGTHGLGTISSGPLTEDVGGLSAGYRFDIHHEQPVMSASELEHRELLDFSVGFLRGRVGCEQALEREYGPADPVEGRRRFGPWFVDAGAADHFTLEWYAHTPDWAEPPADADGRVAAMQDLARKLCAATTYLDVEAAIAEVPDGLGTVADGRGLRFGPPMPAADLARALGREDAVGRTVDVHMASWRLAVPAGDGTDPLRVGPWELDVVIDRATGPRPDGIRFGPVAVAQLAPTDNAHTLWVKQHVLTSLEDAIADVRRALAQHDLPRVSERIERAIAIARFELRYTDGPFRRTDFGGGVPEPPEGPMFPDLQPLRSGNAKAVVDALEALQRALVWEADCAEFTDATNNSAQYLRAAGELDLAAAELLRSRTT